MGTPIRLTRADEIVAVALTDPCTPGQRRRPESAQRAVDSIWTAPSVLTAVSKPRAPQIAMEFLAGALLPKVLWTPRSRLQRLNIPSGGYSC